MGEQHHAESAAHGFGREVVSEAGEDGSGVAVLGGDAAPDGSESLVLLSGLGLVNVDDSLSQVVLGSSAVVDSFKPENGLFGILLNFGSSEAEEFGSDPESNLLSWGLSANLLGLGFGNHFRHCIN